MATKIKTNMAAVRAHGRLDKNDKARGKSLRKVATGMKINSAEDDASSWGISERMRVRIRALEQADQNSQNDSSLMKTAEGAVDNTVDILRTLKAKAIDAANDSNTDEDRQIIQKEVNQLVDQIDDNALVTFNGKYMLNSASGTTITHTSNSNTWSRTILLNQSLATDNTMGTAPTALKNRVGDSLGIQTSDLWQVSWVVNGTTSVVTGTMANVPNLAQLYLGGIVPNPDYDQATDAPGAQVGWDSSGQPLYTPNGEAGVHLVSKKNGVAGALAGYTITITDAQGNLRKSANEALNAFTLLKVAENNFGKDRPIFNFQLGSEANQAIRVSFRDMRAEALGLKGNTGNVVSVTTKDNANAAISVFDNALTVALDLQTNIGAVISRLEYTSNNLNISRDNDQAAESVIRDADMAREMTEYTKNNVLLQAAQAMLAQANQNSSAILSLLQ